MAHPLLDLEGLGDVFEELHGAVGTASDSLKDASMEIVRDAQSEVEHLLAEYKRVTALLKVAANDPSRHRADVMAARQHTMQSIDRVVVRAKERLRALITTASSTISSSYTTETAKAARLLRDREKEKAKEVDAVVGMAEELEEPVPAKDALGLCEQNGARGCAVTSHPPAPLTANPYCACEPRVQQREIENTQYLDFYFNKYTELRRCKGEFCLDCISVLNKAFLELTPTSPEDIRAWCRTAFFPPNTHCEALLRGMELTAEGIKFRVAELIQSALPNEDALDSCAKNRACLLGQIADGVAQVCKDMDCCN